MRVSWANATGECITYKCRRSWGSAGEPDVLLPGRVRPGPGQAAHRVAAVPGQRRGGDGQARRRGSGWPVRSAHKKFGDVAAVWSVLRTPGRGRGRSTRSCRAGPTRPRRRAPTLRWPRLNRIVDSVLEARRSPTGGPPRPGRGGCKLPRGRAGSPPVLGRDGPCCRRPTWPTIEAERGAADGRPSSGWSCPALVLDMTNFATFIDSGNDRAPIAQRGKAKQKRVGSAAGRAGAGRHPRRRGADRRPPLPGRPPRRDPVPRGDRRARHRYRALARQRRAS